MIRLRYAACVVAAVWILIQPSVASAQSAFTGVVRDTSGAVLPGVTVEAASDALIEKARAVVTDGNGAYRLVDLRPGTYSLTFSLEGFSTVKRDGLELQSNFTMTVNTDLRVGALEETLTVTGQAPVVDVQSTTKSQVLNREALDAIPTGRTIQGMGQLITGVSLNSPDVGGSRAMQQTYMSAHGAGASQTTVQVDGLHVNGLDVDGAVQNYFNSSMSQEMVYTTSGASADVAGGGVRLNQIPRDGGNRLSGSLFLGYQQESFQGDNVSQDLINRGLRASDGIEKLYNIEGAVGGPIKKDRIWYFVSARNFVLNTLPSNTFEGVAGTGGPNAAPTASNTRGVDPQSIRSVQARIIWQISQKNKFAVYNDRILKNRGSAMTAGNDPATGSAVWTSPIYTVGTAKFTSAISSRLLFEGGFSTNYERYNVVSQPGIAKPRNTPEWYTAINRQDQSLGTLWGAYTVDNGFAPDRFALMASMSYVTGAHNVKVGWQDTWGRYNYWRNANGDVRAIFRNGVPFQATILNTPLSYGDKLDADMGVFAQDSWTVKRLTLNYGARFERFASSTRAAVSGAGRFVAERSFDAIKMPTWTSVAPRVGVVYDLLGNQKTALKFSFGKYMQAGTTGFASSYNPNALASQNVTWTDLNGDFTPQGQAGCTYLQPGCEVNLAQLPAGFGVANLGTYASDIARMYNLETSAAIQHEVLPGVSVTAGWYKRNYYNLRRRTNVLRTFDDYNKFTVFSPIDGSTIEYYTVKSNKLSAVSYEDQNAPDRTMRYNGFEYNFTARLGRGISLFGGGMSERMLANVCDEISDPNRLLYCDQSKSGLPFRTQFKVAGSVPLAYGINVGISFQSLPGYVNGTTAQYALTGVSGPSGITTNNPPNGAGTVWQITRNTTYSSTMPCVAQGKCTAGQLVNSGISEPSLSVPIVAPMTEYGDRINQLDVNVTKNIKFGRLSIQPKLDIFNMLNVAPVFNVQSLLFGTTAYNKPASVLNPRTFQLGAVVRF
ncbi:MAG: carboxypeptidase regulatory-like domain-containing protein [Vicinamibacterales bacterium]